MSIIFLISAISGIVTAIFYFFVPLLPEGYQALARTLAGIVILVAIGVSLTIFLLLRNRLGALMRIEWNRDKGMLFMGDIRNTRLRLTTIQMIVASLVTYIDDYEEALRDTGKRVGGSFARDLLRELSKHKKTLTTKELLNFWTEYDSNAGLGRLNFDNFNLDTNTGEIRLNYSFLASNGGVEDRRLCSFLEGYIEGVLNQLLDVTVTVRNNCPAKVYHQVCHFNIT